MKVKDVKNSMKNLSKFFVDYEGSLYTTQGLHEQLAREIAAKNNWEWQKSGYYACEDYLMAEQGWIKFSNYGSLKYVSISKKYAKDRKVIDNAIYLSELFNIKLEIF